MSDFKKHLKISRASKNMYRGSDPLFILKLRELITSCPIKVGIDWVNQFIFKLPKVEYEIALRQFLLLNYFTNQLNGKIVDSKYNCKRVYALIPGHWVNFFSRHGVYFYFISAFIFHVSLLRYFAKSVVTYFKAILAIRSFPIKYIQFMDVSRVCLPSPVVNFEQENIFNWFKKNISDDFDHVLHNQDSGDIECNGVIYSKSPNIFPCLDLRVIPIFTFWFIAAFHLILIRYLFGRWDELLLFDEAVKKKWCSLLRDDERARFYIYTISSLIYRPIWTFSCENSRVILLNYAASHSHFKTSHGYPPLDLGHAIINWPEIVLWNESYSEWFKATQSKKNKILTMPPVWFGDSESDLTYLKNDRSKKIAVFDVSPFRPTFANITGSFPQYRTLNNGILFLDDIYELCVKFGIQVLWKRKRQLNKIHHKRYVAYSNEFIKRPGVVEIDPDCAATRLIKYSDAVISMPFTSTAFHASYLGKKSCFYDAAGVLYKEDRGAQDLMLLSGKEELAEWLTSHFG